MSPALNHNARPRSPMRLPKRSPKIFSRSHAALPSITWLGRITPSTNPRSMTSGRTPLHEDDPGKGGFWKYRRIVDRRNFIEGTYRSDICLVNWPQNDYWLGNLID